MSPLRVVSGRHIGGRLPPPPHKLKACLHLSDYAPRGAPAAPASVDYATAARPALSQSYLNDRLGDCVIAALAHAEGVWTANAGDPAALFTLPQIRALYGAIGGYDETQERPDGTNPTDGGCDELTAIEYWRTDGVPLGGRKIEGAILVDARDTEEVRFASWAFESLLMGCGTPEAWMGVQDGGTWGVGSIQRDNGHAFCSAGHDETGLLVATWGIVVHLPWDVLGLNVGCDPEGQCFALLSEDSINRASGRAPSGLDWTALRADFTGLRGTVV